MGIKAARFINQAILWWAGLVLGKVYMSVDYKLQDVDPVETQEWLDSFDSVVEKEGLERAYYLLGRLAAKMPTDAGALPYSITTPYRNTIATTEEEPLAGDLFMERRIRSIIRWNALAMVMRANQRDSTLGGHISTFASSATLYDVGFNHFFHAPTEEHGGDLLYIQGHSAPGIYSRAFLENRISENQLDNYRREVDGNGLSSYPHPWLMPDFWQFPTVSMGLGPLQAIYQAHFMKYLTNRGVCDNSNRKVWAFVGDGEMDEPESLGAISLAGREKLDNLIFVVNCNLQRLDGPVRGNGKIIQELEGVFRGAGWNVIKVVWGRFWDPLLEKDKFGHLQQRMDESVDGEYQNYKSKGGAYTRKEFFGKDPEVLKLVEHLSDDDIYKLNRGGHDPYKVYAAYAAATKHKGQPTVILAKTVKGYGAGDEAEASNKSHSVKELNIESLKSFRDRFDVPLSDDELEQVPYYRPPQDSPELRYMRKQREKLGGFLPQRRKTSKALDIPDLSIFKGLLEGTGERKVSTTMAFVRLLASIVKEKQLGKRVVPIVPDEARTFGMEGLFRQLGIYSSVGQLYEPVDSNEVMYYKEDIRGAILEEGINEAGAMAAWMAAATSYSVNDEPMIPFYIYYSMFGFQRVGDLCWAAGDMQARGFLLGATAGRTTLNGEGLQHQDGHSHLIADTIPNCVAYDPAYAYELVVIVHDGLRRMYQEQENVFYYITLMNENYSHPAMPEGVEQDIIRGMYCISEQKISDKAHVQLLGSGTILREVQKAAVILSEKFDVTADVWSVTSFSELRQDGLKKDRESLLSVGGSTEKPFITACLDGRKGPVIAATDHAKSYADQVRAWVPASYTVLGTDGFGRSDSREKLRDFFEVDAKFVVLAALKSLLSQGEIKASVVNDAIASLGIDIDKKNPLSS